MSDPVLCHILALRLVFWSSKGLPNHAYLEGQPQDSENTQRELKFTKAGHVLVLDEPFENVFKHSGFIIIDSFTLIPCRCEFPVRISLSYPIPLLNLAWKVKELVIETSDIGIDTTSQTTAMRRASKLRWDDELRVKEIFIEFKRIEKKTSEDIESHETSPPEYHDKAKALYAYAASPDDPNEISFSKSEVLDLLDSGGKWWRVRKGDGTTGIAPSNYLEKIVNTKAKALYAYIASPDDPNEIPFDKGDVMDVFDRSGKWWAVRTQDGVTGIAPSNYLQII